MKRLIIDTDPGVDDAAAILLALAHPNAKVEAITTVNGNVDVDKTTANALKILDIAQADVPVYRGCSRPIVNPAEYASYVHGQDGLGDCGVPASARVPQSEHAVHALIRLASENPGELTLVGIGPLTNIAHALRLDPALPSKFKELIVMGGAIRAMGNAGNITAEFNFFADPEAAHITIEAWPMTTILSWETTLSYMFNADHLQKFFALNTPKARFFHDINQIIMSFIHDRLGGQVGLFAPDGLAVAAAIEPEIVTRAENHHVAVELQGPRGQSSVDWMGLTQNAPNANLILDVNHARFIELITNALT